jgi:DNA polymerase-1
MTTNELMLVDLSSIAYPIYMTTQADPDPNRASQQIVARVRALTSDHPHAAICCDSGRSFRNDVAPSYKANRPESEAVLHHQIALAREQLAADGFPIWSVRGFEADDLIATGVARALALDDLAVLIVSADKDLLQLVGPRVRAKSARDGSICDAAAVETKFGVRPDQMRDYLMLVGDAADNVKGAKDIGPKKAADLLQKYGTLAAVYDELSSHPSNFKPGIATSLKEFQPRMEQVKTLISLRADVDLPFEEIAVERVPQAVAAFVRMEDDDMDEQPLELTPPADAPVDAVTSPAPAADAAPSAIARRDVEVLPAPKDWERGLDPRSMKEARVLATDMYESRMFSAYGTPQAVLSTVMVGRELGLPAMASLRCVHVIEGKHSLAASLMVALVLKSGLAEYFEPVSFSDTEATFVTKRKGGRREISLTHTFEMAKAAGLVKDKSGWVKNPVDMLVARASARLARMVYPDLLAGLYTPDELREIRDDQAAA